MSTSSMEPILKKAQESKKQYNWMLAAECYVKASAIAVKESNWLEAAQLSEKLGFCYFRAAFQAEAYPEFRKRIKLVVGTCENGIKFFEAIGDKDQIGIKHVKAFAVYARSYLETNAQKRREMLAEWWILENQVLKIYENAGDPLSVGKTCNRMLEHSNYYRFWLTSNLKNRRRVLEEGFILAEKAIQVLSKLNDSYELARAYIFASWFYSWGDQYWDMDDKIIFLNQKCQDYAHKALTLSQKTGDAWLIGWAQIVAWNAAFLCNLNPASGLDFAEKAQKYGEIAKDKFLIGFGNTFIAWATIALAINQEDPDKQKAMCENAAETAQQGINNFRKINHIIGLPQVIGHLSTSLSILESIEVDREKKKGISRRITKIIEELHSYLREGKLLSGFFFLVLSRTLFFKSKTERDIEEKRRLLQEAQIFAKKHIADSERDFSPFWGLAFFYHELFLVQNGLATIETNDKEKTRLIKQSIISIERSIEIIEKKEKLYSQSGWQIGLFGQYYEKLGRAFQNVYALTKEVNMLPRAIEAYENANLTFEKVDLPTHTAEIFWHIAQVQGQLGKHKEASQSYLFASHAYEFSAKKIPQLKAFYKNYSEYMLAWNQIEQARHDHSNEEYEKAREHYKKAASIHEASEYWSFFAPNYFAWASVEEAEGLSRTDQTEKARLLFKKALEQFNKAEESIKERLKVISSEEKDIILRLLKVTDFRRNYSKARILIEQGKLLDRKGKYLQSAQSYAEASKQIKSIIKELENEYEVKELHFLETLCRAWEQMAIAEETTSPKSYLEAAEHFEHAKILSATKRTSLWALGNSNFCKGLAAGVNYQTGLELEEHSKAKSFMKNASTTYSKAGFKAASEYAKATLRLFDAYLFMNLAESESDTEKRVKQYQLSENLLQLAAGSFMKANQPEKTVQVQQILDNVREEKQLAISFNEVLQAPTIASSTVSFSTPTPTSEASVGLELFEHANVQANLVTHTKDVKVGESFCLSVEFVNAGREPALLMRVDDFVPKDFVVVKKPEIYRIEESCLNMKGKQIAPLKLVEVKLTLQPSKKGEYQLNPRVHYLNELGQNKSLQLKTLEINVEEVILEDRVSTGTEELDSLLLGGIPKEYAIVLSGSPSDEREYIVKNFLESGIREDNVVFYVSTEADGLENHLENPNFVLFLCNPKPKSDLRDLTNIFKLRSKTDLTNLSISLAKAYRNIGCSKKKRICIGTVSDVLITHKAEATRRWISELITDLSSKGFTMLAVMNPAMHPSDQAIAVIDLFDGEISITQSSDPLDCKKSILVKKLRNQDYIKNPICLT